MQVDRPLTPPSSSPPLVKKASSSSDVSPPVVDAPKPDKAPESPKAASPPVPEHMSSSVSDSSRQAVYDQMSQVAEVVPSAPDAPPLSASKPKTKADIPTLKEQLKTAQTQILQLQAKMPSAHPSQQKLLSSQILALKTQVTKLKQEITSLQIPSNTKTMSAQVLTSKHNIFRKMIEESGPEASLNAPSQEDISGLKGKLAEANGQIAELTGRIEALKPNKHNPKVAIQIAALEMKLKPLKVEKTNLEQQIGRREMGLKSERANVQDAVRQVKTLTNRVAELEHLVALGKKEPIRFTRQQQKELAQDLKVAQFLLNKLKKEYPEAEQELASVDSQIKAASNSNMSGKINWSKVKAKNLESDDRFKPFMLGAVEFRQQYVEHVLNQVKAEMGLPELKVSIPGSTDLTSDIDINIEIPNSVGKDTAFIAKFNETFRKAWGNESGSMLDVNLYVKGLMPDFVKESREGPYIWKDDANRIANDRGQDVASLIKMRKFLGEAYGDGEAGKAKWTEYKDAMLASLPPDQRAEARGRYQEAEDYFDKGVKELHAEMAKLKETFPDLNPIELDLMANNRLYEKYLVDADTLMSAALESGNEADMVRAKTDMAKCHLFANEAAFTEGVLRHVVANEQGIPRLNGDLKKEGKPLLEPVKLSNYQVLESFTENVADAFKEFHHRGATLPEAAIYSSKYLGRLARGADMMLERLKTAQPPVDIEKLKTANPKLARALAFKDKLHLAEKGANMPDVAANGGLLTIRKDKFPDDKDRKGDYVEILGKKHTRAQEIWESSGLENIASVDQLRDSLLELNQEVTALYRAHVSTIPEP